MKASFYTFSSGVKQKQVFLLFKGKERGRLLPIFRFPEVKLKKSANPFPVAKHHLARRAASALI